MEGLSARLQRPRLNLDSGIKETRHRDNSLQAVSFSESPPAAVEEVQTTRDLSFRGEHLSWGQREELFQFNCFSIITGMDHYLMLNSSLIRNFGHCGGQKAFGLVQ